MVLSDEQAAQFVKIDLEKITQKELGVPRLIFSDTQPSTHSPAPIRGLATYGPYDFSTTDGEVKRKFNGIEFSVFYPREQPQVHERLARLTDFLENGYFEQRKGPDVPFRSLSEEFRLKEVSMPSKEEFIPYKPGELGETIDASKIDVEDTIKRGNIPLALVGGIAHRSAIANREQYIEAKREFSKRNIACQFASYYEIEPAGLGILYLIEDKERPFGYSVWNIALGTYGKSGGLAWVVDQESVINPIDLTIGLGFARLPGSLTVTGERYHIGYATILDRFGKLIGVISSNPFPSEFDMRTKSMVIPGEVLRNVVHRAVEKGLSDPRFKKIAKAKPGLRLSVHRLSFFHPTEIEATKMAVTSATSNMKSELGLVSIISRPSLVMFDKLAKSMNTTRGTMLTINDNSFLLYTAGPNNLTSAQPISYPITGNVPNLGEGGCAFRDLAEACGHISSISALHWQTAIQGTVRLPASLEFARYIAHSSARGVQPPENSWLWNTLWFV